MDIKGNINLLGGKLYLNSAATMGDQSFTGFAATMTYGETITVGQALYLKTDGKMWKADANAATSMPVAMIALEAGNADEAKNVLLFGYMRNDAWAWTVGGIIYASLTAGGIVQDVSSFTTGDQVQVLGIATHADRIFFNPNYTLFEIA